MVNQSTSSVHQWCLALVRSIISSPWILRASLHHGPWSWTMEDGLFPWSSLMVNILCSDFLKNQFTKPLGLSLGVNRMWSKKNDHAPKSECVDYLKIYAQKGHFWRKKNSSSTILLSSLGLHLSSFLVKCVKDVACKSSHNNFYQKNEWVNFYLFNAIYMWHVPHVVQWALFATRFIMCTRILEI